MTSQRAQVLCSPGWQMRRLTSFKSNQFSACLLNETTNFFSPCPSGGAFTPLVLFPLWLVFLVLWFLCSSVSLPGHRTCSCTASTPDSLPRLPFSRHFLSVLCLLAIIFFIGLFRHRGMFIFKGFESLKKWWEERNVIYLGKALRRKIEKRSQNIF